MHDFTRKFLTEWRKLKLPFEEKTFVAAVSGGADSVSLLLVLNDLRTRRKLEHRFVIAHFNHNLREDESEKDAEFVKALCVKFNFELALGNGNVAKQGNIEQNARIARYEFLRKTAENLHADAVLTAHTINDQAETFLINLIRGSGLQGLSGMKAVRNLERGNDKSEIRNLQSGINKSQIQLVRPLLNWATRADTENFCRVNEIEYRYDTMNEDLAFKRVRVRKVLLPLLEDFNPKIIQTLAQTAKFLSDELKVSVENKSIIPKTDEQFLKLNELVNLTKPLLYQTLREWLAFNRGNLRGLELKHIEAVERLIFSRKSGKTIELPNGETVVKENGKLAFKIFKVEK
jgi:tRNA(Ile)-lysidine synthase